MGGSIRLYQAVQDIKENGKNQCKLLRVREKDEFTGSESRVKITARFSKGLPQPYVLLLYEVGSYCASHHVL